ncbi:diaminopimelate decarboxylase [Actinoplanes cyaneus]|uniref:Diaminopimelate decarboxylase n=2 Tax=Actinoplanes cyaneus TaxID=52696 RepID=A0A919MGQ6_9ACTN|nr:diaminopimelate decarboxylase [Actinoplanes cyaneus]GID70491.1 diaminopimelate decarboxylase [Actinoplanes cyaneus]
MQTLDDVQGVPFIDLADRFGTPLYVYDSAVLTATYRRLRAALNPGLELLYSLKANPNVSVCAVLGSLGAGAEVSSVTELMTARRAGIPADRILFLGPGKGAAEHRMCLDEGVGAVVVESLAEMRLLDELARSRGTVAPVVLRVNPAFTVKGARLTMGGRPRQFGIDEMELMDRPGLLRDHPGLRIRGVHVYLGTRILDEALVVENTTRILDLAVRLAARLGFPLELVDVGGGLGVAYFDGERDLDVDTLAAGLNPVLAAFRADHPATRLIMELGRYLSADAGIYVSRVLYTKTSMGARFAVLDGGTHHHMAAVGIGSYVKRNFPIRKLGPDAGDHQPWQLAGPLCTPNDLLGKNVPLPELRSGDLVGVLRSGAYGPTASPVRFLSHGYPAEVLVHEGQPYLVRERERPEDLLDSQRLAPVVAPVAG